jgi:predicted aminopeptidase
VIRSLDSAYAAHPESKAARIAARDSVYAHTRLMLVNEIAPQFKTINPIYAQRVTLNNAALLARRVYATDLDVFDRVYEKEGRDLRRAIGRIISLAKAHKSNPFEALRDWTAGSANSHG